MATFRVSLIARPDGWQPTRPDDVPSQPGALGETLCETDDLLAAVQKAIDHNEADGADWAVVVEPGAAGVIWPKARLCTPLGYKATTVWWPEGWEPESTLDVPNCVFKAPGEMGQERLTYPEAQARVRALNQQSLDQAANVWYVVVAVENEPISCTVSRDSAGTETTTAEHRLHVIGPDTDGGQGDCSHCPACKMDCASEGWTRKQQTITTTEIRPVQ